MRRFPRRQSRLLWKLFLGYVLLTASSLGLCALLIVRELDEYHAEELTERLRGRAVALRSAVRGKLDTDHLKHLDELAKTVGIRQPDGLRITFVDAHGRVLGESHAEAARMDSHHDRAEIRAALEQGWGTSTRWSDTLSRTLKYVALRVGPKEDPEGVVRVAIEASTLAVKTRLIRRIIWTVVIITLSATAAFALGAARLWTLPIRRITAIAGRLSGGDLSARARVRGSDELARLARSLNEMRDHLSAQLTTIEGQRRTLEAIVSQLHEGVILAGPDGRIVLANPAAVRLLNPEGTQRASPAAWRGRPVEHCVPQHELQRLLLPNISAGRQVFSAPGDRRVGEVRIELATRGSRTVVLASASDIVLPVIGSGGTEPGLTSRPPNGRILTLTDITEISRMVQMKSDFVANASHELRTPLSTIRGAIETVLDMDLSKDARSARRFLEVIDRHSARLEALVADLLALSRLESPASEIKPTTFNFSAFCDELHARWADAAAEKQHHWQCNVPPDLGEVTADPQLLRLALDNLIDNAVKFTPPGGHIAVNCKKENGGLVVEVSDDGCGIPNEDQERVFERFYQVVQARSGTGSVRPVARGTGLGLSIVRHAVAAMNGTVALTSTPGAGTKVTIGIPQPGRG